MEDVERNEETNHKLEEKIYLTNDLNAEYTKMLTNQQLKDKEPDFERL